MFDEIGRPGGDDLPFVFSGTMVVQGQGFAEIRATGAKTELGKIGKALGSIEPQATRLQTEVNRLAKVLAILGLTTCAVIAIVYGLTRESWINGLLAGITTAMSLLPEEFPLSLRCFSLWVPGAFLRSRFSHAAAMQLRRSALPRFFAWTRRARLRKTA